MRVGCLDRLMMQLEEEGTYMVRPSWDCCSKVSTITSHVSVWLVVLQLVNCYVFCCFLRLIILVCWLSRLDRASAFTEMPPHQWLNYSDRAAGSLNSKKARIQEWNYHSWWVNRISGRMTRSLWTSPHVSVTKKWQQPHDEMAKF